MASSKIVSAKIAWLLSGFSFSTKVSTIISSLSLLTANSNLINASTKKKLNFLADIINDHFLTFASIGRHIDVIHTILDYIINFANGIHNKAIASTYDKNMLFHTLVITLFTICKDADMRFLMGSYLIPKKPHQTFNMYLEYILEMSALYDHCIQMQDGEMIILEDSDLYAVVNCLRITSDYKLRKIWVQEQVKEKFLWLIKRYYHSITNIPIDTFYSLKDVQLNICQSPSMKILSIWSENIVAVKNLALFFNMHMTFINTYMDFFGGIVIWPPTDCDFTRILFSIRNNKFPDVTHSVNVIHLSRTVEKNATSIYNLFYDGTWQKPTKHKYWKYNGSLWANATNDDILRCYESAKKGFETWSIKSIKTRIQILSKFVSILKDNGKLGLAAVVDRCLKCPYLYESITGFRNTKIEVIHTRIPIGVTILREENENVFFFRLIQTLIAGNSVIVMFSPNFYNLIPHYDTFSICGVPPGVINLLSHEDANMLEMRLCSGAYTDYAKKYFLKCNSIETYILQYKQLTIPKQIVLQV
ncbi:uncharacterized protein LOC105200524 isoform X2 [Solenopsis invicta]|uniref:uncharacterized protein LOC105200524 isoform X2 n=2 Tax=Solenopsis invicta TaxID=13686 RepID=UPI00193D2C23|nr:uncharacterized protein LOC105200524 isoform X2 [Solenopsis invicta]